MAARRGYVSAVPISVRCAGSAEGARSAGGESEPTLKHVVRVVASDTGAAVANKWLENRDAGCNIAKIYFGTARISREWRKVVVYLIYLHSGKSIGDPDPRNVGSLYLP